MNEVFLIFIEHVLEWNVWDTRKIVREIYKVLSGHIHHK
jgi:hypothetical protein